MRPANGQRSETGPPGYLYRSFDRLDLQAKLAVALIVPAILMGLVVMVVVSLITWHLIEVHNQIFHLFAFLLPIFLIAGLFVFASLTLFARMIVRLIHGPLIAIAAAAENIAESGRPSGTLPVRHNDEFGRLTAAFNTMVERLAESYNVLEQRVAERTREYEESQREAQLANNLLREAVQHVAVGFTIYDENDHLAICNEAYLRIYADSRDLIVPGASFEEIVRRGAERGQYREAIGRVDTWVKERVAQHRSARGEVIEQKLGNGRWLMIIEHRTPSGYIVGNRIDITELKNASEALRQRELYLQATLDNLPFLFWLKDADSRFLAVNRMFAEACGRGSPEQVVGLTDLDVWPRELAERYRADDFAVMTSRQEKAVEEPVAGGSAAGWIETYKKPVIADDGTVMGTVGFARDISDRRAAEAKIREHNEQLNAIFELSPDGFVSFDQHRRIKYASPAFLRMTGFAPAMVDNLGEATFSALLAAACIETARFPGLPALRAQTKVGAGATASGTHDEARQIVELSGAGKRILEIGLRESASETGPHILYFRDITHEKEVERLKSEFLSTAAHELRTPMASIYGFTELLLSQEFPPEEQREYLNMVFRQTELMVSIINELLDLARIEARRGKDFLLENVSLELLVQEIVLGFKPPKGRAPPDIALPPEALTVRADQKKLAQAIGNVLSNAYKYSPEGGRVVIDFITPPRATTNTGEALPQQYGVRIADCGIGMTAEQLGRIFERFYRADTSGKIPGTGLGMSIVKEIIELHGGRIDIDSSPGQGTTVTLWLPALTADPTPLSTEGELP
jgi:PAS domain S-box-containing protein